MVTTAPTWTQVEDLLWREIHACLSRAKRPLFVEGKSGRLLKTQLELGPKWYAVGKSTDDPVNLQGYHASNILVILDEADGIPKEIWTAIDSTLTSGNAKLLAIGNPLDPTSEFKRRHDRALKSNDKAVIRISADDVLPASATHKFLLQRSWVDEKLLLWGENSPLSAGKIYARWPEAGSDSLIPLPWIMRARARSVPRGIRTLGVDVARLGGNRTVRTLLEGDQLIWSRASAMEDTVQTAMRVLGDIRTALPLVVAIDETGVGGGVLDQVRANVERDADVTLFGVNNGAKPIDETRFVNRGSEMWWQVREGFERDRFGLSMDDPEAVDELISDLARPTYFFQERTAKIRVDKFGRHHNESDMTIPERAEASPDRGDSYVLAVAAARPYIQMGVKTVSRSTSYLPKRDGWLNV